MEYAYLIPKYPIPPHPLGIDWGKQLILKTWQLDKAIFRLTAWGMNGIVLYRIIKCPFGLHLGSGPEIALSCCIKHFYIQSTPFSFPYVNLGESHALSGTQFAHL